MYINIVFIFYIIAILISFVCLVFIGLVFVRKNDRNNRTYLAVRRFAVVVMLTALLYFIFYYREIVQQEYELVLPFRLADYALCTGLYLCWFLVMGNMMDTQRHRRVIVAGVILSVVRLGVSLFITSVYMGEYYNIGDPDALRIWTAVEIIFILLTSIAIIYCSVCTAAEAVVRLRKTYTLVCSTLLLFWGIVQGVVDMGLFAGKYGVSAWALELPDFTGAAMFLLNLATCIFVFQEDFSPLFFSDEKVRPNPVHLTGVLDTMAADHRLTVREREVLELMYQGCTNPEIAQQLYISVNTVKKHTHNIFEKLDAGNRMEVVHLVNARSPEK